MPARPEAGGCLTGLHLSRLVETAAHSSLGDFQEQADLEARTLRRKSKELKASLGSKLPRGTPASLPWARS